MSQNYQRRLHVAASPQQAYQALTSGFKHWWTTPDKTLEKEGDVAKFTFSEKLGYWTFKATLLSPSRIELECVDALHLHEGMPKAIEKEWLGTTLVWQINKKPEGTEIIFEHKGLLPSLLCYEICEAGWDMFFVDSLQAYLDSGVGKPFGAAA